MRKLLFLCVLVCPFAAQAQNWSAILNANRATEWANVGVVGGIPSRTTRCGSVISAYTGTAATINTAIDNCTAGQYVELGAGTFTLSTGVELDQDNVTLRGQGANSTSLIISGITDNGCHIGDGRVFNMCQGASNIGIDSPDNTATWSSGYAKGTTVITLSSHTNMVVGSTLWLDQTDDTGLIGSSGYPATGDVWIKSWNGGNAYERAGRGLTEGHIVTACGVSTPGAACTSNTITISPGVIMPTIRSGQSPGAWWGNTSSVLDGAGLENLSVEVTAGSGASIIYMLNCTNCYIKGVRTVRAGTISSGQYRLNNFIQTVNASVVNSYFHGPQASGLVSIYGMATHLVSNSLFQNNIVHMSVNPFVINSPTYGNVFAYNYFDNAGINPSFSQSSFILHGHASMNLFEGNNGKNLSGDNIATSHFFNTLFRNQFDGTLRNPSGTETQAAGALYGANRFFNFVGNVLGASNWVTYNNGQSPPSQCQTCIYEFGWQGTNSAGIAATGNDTRVSITSMRWGNWDSVNNATRFVSGEVPTGITNYSNTVPASQSLPSSFYLNSKPSWFGSVPWPPIGPDVNGGNVPTAPTDGHAWKLPARNCFEAMAPGSSVGSFNAAICYESDQPTPPTGLRVISIQ